MKQRLENFINYERGASKGMAAHNLGLDMLEAKIFQRASSYLLEAQSSRKLPHTLYE